jgi:hypothetical protein
MADTSGAPGSEVSSSAYKYPESNDTVGLGGMQGAGSKVNGIWVSSWQSKVEILIFIGFKQYTYTLP